MSKLRLKFNKTDNMIYISHLDMMRVIQRAMKRAQLRVEYSQGFNPHALMSFSTAVPLGLTINNEYMDISMEGNISPEEYIQRINPCLPKGLKMIDGKEIDEKEKPIMGQIRWGSYLICINTKNSDSIIEKIDLFLNRESITYIKEKKKKKRWMRREVEIRPLIESIDVFVNESDFLVLKVMIRTGSEGNLKPEKMMELMKNLEEIDVILEDIKYQRLDLFLENDDEKIKPI